MEPKILFKGKILPQNINIHYSLTSNRKVNEDYEAQALNKWSEIYSKAKDEGKEIWISNYYRLDELKQNNNKLDLTLSTIPFSLILGYRELGLLQNLHQDYYTNHMSVGSLVQTSDNKYIFGERSGKTMSRSNIDMIGGGLNTTEINLNSGEDIYQMLIKEFEEEISLKFSDISSSECIGIVLSRNMNVIFIFETKLKISSEKLYSNFKSINDKKELKDLIFIDEDKLGGYLDELGSYKSLVKELLK
jgi:hypothetical protein